MQQDEIRRDVTYKRLSPTFTVNRALFTIHRATFVEVYTLLGGLPERLTACAFTPAMPRMDADLDRWDQDAFCRETRARDRAKLRSVQNKLTTLIKKSE
jgi:hypothetical protein